MKRANGTGSIVKRKERRNPYLVYGPAIRDGDKRHIPYLGSFRTSAEAQKFLDAYNQNPCGERFKVTFEKVYEEFKASPHYIKLGKKSKSG